MDKKYRYATCNGEAGVCYKSNRFAFSDIKEAGELGQAAPGEQYFISFEYLCGRKHGSKAKANSFAVKESEIVVLDNCDLQDCNSMNGKMVPALLNDVYGVAVASQQELAQLLMYYPFEDDFTDFPPINIGRSDECYFVSFMGAAQFSSIPFQVVLKSQLKLFVGKKGPLLARTVATPCGITDFASDISAITTSGDSVSDVSLEMNQTPALMSPHPTTMTTLTPATQLESPSLRGQVRFRIAGPSDLNKHLAGGVVGGKRSSSGDDSIRLFELFDLAYPTMKCIGWQTESWRAPIMPVDDLVYRVPKWDDMKVVNRIENLEFFHSKVAFAQHISSFQCFSESFEWLWKQLSKFGWCTKPANNNGGAGVVYHFALEVCDDLDTMALRAVHDAVLPNIEKEELRLCAVTSGDLIPGVHLFETSESLIQYISKFPYLTLNNEEFFQFLAQHNIHPEGSKDSFSIAKLGIKKISARQLRRLMWLYPAMPFVHYADLTPVRLMQAIRVPFHVALRKRVKSASPVSSALSLQDSRKHNTKAEKAGMQQLPRSPSSAEKPVKQSIKEEKSSRSPSAKPVSPTAIQRFASALCSKEDGEDVNESMTVYDLLQILTANGWKLQQPTWTKSWWKHLSVHIAPWCLKSNPVVGIDYFFNCDDMLDYLAAYGHVRAGKSKLKLRENYTSEKYTLDMALTHFANAGKSEVVKLLLIEKGWVEVVSPQRKSPLLIPAIRARDAECISENLSHFVPNVDYFSLGSPAKLLESVLDNAAEASGSGKKRARDSNSQSITAAVAPSPLKLDAKLDKEVPSASKLKKIRSEDAQSSASVPQTIDLDCVSPVSARNAHELIKSIVADAAADQEDPKWSDKYLFQQIWPTLSTVGWKKDWVTSKALDKDYEYVFLPSWAGVSSKLTREWLQVNAARENRDFFYSVEAVLKYVFKYGCVKPAVSEATPPKFTTVMVRRDEVHVLESFVQYYDRVERPQEISKRKLELQAQATARKAAKKSKLPELPSPPKARVSKAIAKTGPILPDDVVEMKNIFDEYAEAKRFYIFPRLWEVICESGWKSFDITTALGLDEVVYCPPTSTINEETCSKLDELEYVLNKDYFNNKEHFAIYLHQQCFPDDSLPALPQQERKRFPYTFDQYFDKFHVFDKSVRPVSKPQQPARVKTVAAKAVVEEEEVDIDIESIEIDFEPEWQALLDAATRRHHRIDLSNFDQVWKLCCDVNKRYGTVKLGKTFYYHRQDVEISSVQDLKDYVRNVHYFASRQDFLTFVRNFGTGKGANIDQLIREAKSFTEDHISDSSDDESTESQYANSTDGLELSSCWPYHSLQGTKDLSHEHHCDALAASIAGEGTPVLSKRWNGTDLPLSPISDISDEGNFDSIDSTLYSMLQQPHIPFARIFEQLNNMNPPWSWINRPIPSEICGEPIPKGVEAIYFKPLMNIKSENMRRGEHFFCRETELLDYLRVQYKVQADKSYESESKKARSTRSGKSLQSAPSRSSPRRPTAANIPIAKAASPSSSSSSSCIDGGIAANQKKRKLEDSFNPLPSMTCGEAVSAALENLKPGTLISVAENTRIQEVDELTDAVSAAISSSTGGSVYVYGEPGIGKTLVVKNVLDSVLEARQECSLQRAELQGTSLHPDTMWKEIAERLGIASGTNADCKQIVLNRFRSSVGTGKGKRTVPLTFLVIDEADRAPKEEVRALMEIAGSKNVSADSMPLCFSPSGSMVNNSSLFLISIANIVTFPTDIGLPAACRPLVKPFVAYNVDQITAILEKRCCGLFESRALNFLAKTIVGRQCCDVRTAIEVASKCLQQELRKRKESDESAFNSILAEPCKPLVQLSTVLLWSKEESKTKTPFSKLCELFNILSQYTKVFLVAILVGGMEDKAATARDMLRMHNTYLATRNMGDESMAEVTRHVEALINAGFLCGGNSSFGGARRSQQSKEEAEYSLRAFEISADMLLKVPSLPEIHRRPLQDYVDSKKPV